MTEQIPGHRLATIHPAAIPGALRLHQDAIATLQRTLRHELTKLQAEEAILKLMVRREVQQLRGKRRREASDEEAYRRCTPYAVWRWPGRRPGRGCTGTASYDLVTPRVGWQRTVQQQMFARGVPF